MLHCNRLHELLEMLSAPPEEAWRSIVRFWADAERVYAGPAGPNGWIAPEYDLAQLIPRNIANAEKYLASELSNSNPIVAAYCVVSLAKLYDQSENFLPQKYAKIVSNREEPISVSYGCFGTRPTLSKFAMDYTDTYGLDSETTMPDRDITNE